MSGVETHMSAGVPGAGRELWPPHGAEPLVHFRVDGDPKPAGSKVSGVVTRWDPNLKKRVPVERPGGGFQTFTKDDSGRAGSDWRSDVRSACSDALQEAHVLADGPLAVRVTFFSERPRSHFGTGRNAGVLKVVADRFPHRGRLADGTKLVRALEDALNKVCWTDDRRIVDLWWSRRFGRPGAEVAIFALPVAAAPGQMGSLLDLAREAGYHSRHGERDREAAEALTV